MRARHTFSDEKMLTALLFSNKIQKDKMAGGTH